MAIDGLPEPGTRLQVGIRPPSVVVDAAGAGGLHGEIVYRENLGSDLFIHVELQPGRQRVVARCDPDRAEALPIGAVVSLQFPADKTLLFAESGRRIQTGVKAAGGHAAALRGVAG
jgi:multiple sugar transport system ATP-binding protein